MQILRKIQDKRDKKSPNGSGNINILAPGTAAPDFTLPGTNGQQIHLEDLKGRPVVLAFYPADHSPVCSSQLALYNEALPLFKDHDAHLLGISTDDIDTHKAFSENLNLSFPLLSDNDPTGEIARAFGAFDEQKENCRRALFVIDEAGIIQWSHISPNDVNPGANGILDALEKINSTNEPNS
jgi:peroxiredoxin